MKFSIFGSNGFIGSSIVDFLKSQQIDCNLLKVKDGKIFEGSLGHVIYGIGVTGDFRERTFDTVESHVCLLNKILKDCKFDSFLYLSSTRVYSGSNSTNETDQLLVNPNNPDNLYNISKLMGESLCLASSSQNVRIARISNVVGNKKQHNDFLSSIIHDAVFNKKIILNTTPTSEKDYVNIEDVVRILINIVVEGKEKIYNVASGTNTKVIEITDEIKKITNCEINFAAKAIERSFQIINIKRIQKEFNFRPSSFLTKLDDMILSEIKKI